MSNKFTIGCATTALLLVGGYATAGAAIAVPARSTSQKPTPQCVACRGEPRCYPSCVQPESRGHTQLPSARRDK